MNNMRNKILSLLVLLLTAATSARASIAVGDVFMFGTHVNFGNSRVYCKFKSGSNDTDKTGMSGNPLMTYGGYDGVKHKLVFTFTSATSYLYIVSDNPVQPYGIKVSGGDGTEGSLFTFSAVYDLADGHTADLNIGSDDACSFAMPPCDVTATYAIARELSEQTKVNVIIGSGDAATTVTDDTRLRITNNNGVYAPVSALSCSFTDEIENVSIDKDGLETAKLTPQFYLQGDNNTWTLVTDINATTHLPNGLQPGQVYCLTLKAADGSYYDGETPKSITVTLFEGYEVTVPAKEFITYYKDEPLRLDNADKETIEIYTVSSVSGTTATLSSAVDAMKANKPMLVYNKGDVDKTILLIPCDEPDLQLTFAPEFKGTLTASTIAASTDNVSNYALNGKQFVIVRSNLEIGANKCWLSVEATSGARAINLVFDDATRIDGMIRANDLNGDYYDLNGRKLQGIPTRKGIYIKNGKKVVVK